VHANGPSLTARGVAAARWLVVRPSSPTGDPAADERLTEAIAGEILDVSHPHRDDHQEFLGRIAVRTHFFDDAVVRAIDAGTRQIVILGAGYDGRALRFRTPGVRFFEVDHPATQRDKRARLVAVGASTADVTFVAFDFTEDGFADALAAAGHDRGQRSLLIGEGLLRYLPERWYRELLRVLATRAAPGSELAVSVSTRPPDPEAPDAARIRREREQRLAAAGEPVLTVPDTAVGLRWLTDAGWSVETVADVADSAPGNRRGRLLVRAVPLEPSHRPTAS
jgi:methyltransferase (TIGR00027 family)